MSWHYSQALEEEYSVGNCSDGKLFAPWSSVPSAPDDLCSVKMKDTLHRSPYGMMFVPSTDGPGVELLTWFLEASLAKISPLPGKGPELMEKEAACGEKWQGSLMKYDPDSRSWKTHQHSLFGGLVEFLETWPRWGTMRNGECWELPMWERTTKEKGSGLWPTPRAGKTTDENEESWRKRKEAGKVSTPPLTLAVKMWPTPERAKDKFNNLESVMAREIFPTPTNSMMTVGDMEQARFAGTDKRRPDYATANKIYPTPTTMDHVVRKGMRPSRAATGRTTGYLSETIHGQLNPTWVEWLMGWPLGWTACEPLETGKCHNATLKLGEGF